MSLRKQFADSLNSLALANAGEMLTRREKRRLLDLHVNHPVPNRPVNHSGRRGAIAIGGDEERLAAMLDYAYGSCQRLGVDLVVLTQGLTSRGIDALAENSRRFRDAAIPMRITQLNGEWSRSVRRFLRQHREVMFLALSDLDSHSQSLLNPNRGQRHRFPVPLVMVDHYTPTLSVVD